MASVSTSPSGSRAARRLQQSEDGFQPGADPAVGPRRVAATGGGRMLPIGDRRRPAQGLLAAGVSGGLSTLFEKE
jgi:hypothetical protein